MTNTITGKLIAVLTLCLALIHGGSAYIDYQLSRDEILERVRLESLDTVNSVMNDLELWLNGVQKSTLLFAHVLAQNKFSPDDLNHLLANALIDQDDIYGATIALNPDFEGNPVGFAPYYYRKNGGISYVDLAEDGKKYWQNDWYAAAVAAAKPVWIEPYFDSGAGEILMTTFSIPIYHSNASGRLSLYAVLTADVALERLHTYLQQLRLGQSSKSVLLTRGGIVMSSSRREDIVQNYLDALSAPPDRELWQRSFEAALRGETLVFPMKCPGGQGLCSTRISTLTSTGWPLAVIYSEDELLSPLRTYGAKSAMIGLATLLLMALAISVIARRLTKPLVALASASDLMAQGQLKVPLPRVKGKDEIAR
jgi:sigma-B regulation protein RsbU (phosphoserine phosphatase)